MRAAAAAAVADGTAHVDRARRAGRRDSAHLLNSGAYRRRRRIYKARIDLLVVGLAREVAKESIRVNAVRLGPTDTMIYDRDGLNG